MFLHFVVLRVFSSSNDCTESIVNISLSGSTSLFFVFFIILNSMIDLLTSSWSTFTSIVI